MFDINTLLAPLSNTIIRRRKWIGYFFFLLSLSVLFGSFSGQVDTKFSGGQSFNILWFLLFLPILARVFSLKIAQALMPLRKEIGIFMGILALAHGFSYLRYDFSEVLRASFWIQEGVPTYLAYGFFALLIIGALTLTSNAWSQRWLGRSWKYLHRFVYIALILTIFHVVVYKYSQELEIGPILIFLVYMIGKILEWKGVSFGKNTDTKCYSKGQKWLCTPCGYIYDPVVGDPDSGIRAGTEFTDIPDSWSCPLCGVKKSDFVPYDEEKQEVTISGKVAEKNMLNPTTLELVIETEEEIPSMPGQFMGFLWEDGNGQFSRSYSIAHQDQKRYTFLIQVGKGGRGASILKDISTGDSLRVRGVAGRFLLKETHNPKIFIATGTGLAPIYRMMTALPVSESKSLYFSVAKFEDMFYEEKLRGIESLDLHLFLSREAKDGYQNSRVDVDTITASPDTEWYICGNPNMVKEVREKLTKRGFENVYSEEF